MFLYYLCNFIGGQVEVCTGWDKLSKVNFPANCSNYFRNSIYDTTFYYPLSLKHSCLPLKQFINITTSNF